MTSNATDLPLPDPNRYITINNDNAMAVFSTEVPVPVPVMTDLGGALLRLAYLSPPPPALLTNQTDLNAYVAGLQDPPPLVSGGGVAASWYIDTPPRTASPLHRTVSLDIVVQLEGEIELSLDSGETRILKRGDMTIQRSTLHAWTNKSPTKWSRFLGIMTGCHEVMVGNQTLGTILPTS